MFELSIKDSFSAAHFLRDYEGKCENLHGHNWQVEVAIKGKELNKTGLLLDFKKLKKYLKGILEELDHKHLNEIGFFQKNNPSSENIAVFIYRRLQEEIKSREEKISLAYVKVWEQENSAALYRED